MTNKLETIMKKNNVLKHDDEHIDLRNAQRIEQIYSSLLKRIDDIQKESQQWIGMNHEQFKNKERCNNG